MNNLVYIEIDKSAVKQNIKNLKSLLKPETKFLAVIKSNAYGHGLVDFAKLAVESGANWLGVVSIEEALEIRKEKIKEPILVLGYPAIWQIQEAAQKDIAIPIIDLDQAREIAKMKLSSNLRVHLKIDTGLNRLGMLKEEAVSAYKALNTNPNIKVEGIYSHLASIEENNLDHAQVQFQRFQEAIEFLKNQNIEFTYKHIAASAAVMLLPNSHYDLVRFGIVTYGLWPSNEVKELFLKKYPQFDENFLKPALSFKTKITQIKEVSAGSKIGYGCTYEAKGNMVVGIIPVGYYEGLDRGLSNIGKVLVGGKRCPIIGRICMNMTIIDVSQVEDVKGGDEVMIIGRQGDEEITADEFAGKIGTINYEVVTRLPEHLERKYV